VTFSSLSRGDPAIQPAKGQGSGRCVVDYERNGEKEILASRPALFFRSTFMALLASALTRGSRRRAASCRCFSFGEQFETSSDRSTYTAGFAGCDHGLCPAGWFVYGHDLGALEARGTHRAATSPE
jgi:hypothetical protein